MSPAIEAIALTKRYGRRTALDRLDLRVERGTVFGMVGPNGAGKTTTMRMLLDIIRPTDGTALVLGEEPRAGGPRLRERIGYLPGELKLDGRLTGGDMLEHFARLSGGVPAGRIQSLADRLGLDLSRRAGNLSKGNKQKLGLVQAFMHEPELLVLDEPTSGLDPLVQQEFLAMVREARDNGQSVFLSSHVLSEIQQAADSVGILRAGELVTVSTVEALRETAMRHVRVVVAPSGRSALLADLDRIPGVSDVRESAGAPAVAISARLSNGVADFVRALARHEVLDLVVEEADLEEAILTYYGTDLRASEEESA